MVPARQCRGCLLAAPPPRDSGSGSWRRAGSALTALALGAALVVLWAGRADAQTETLVSNLGQTTSSYSGLHSDHLQRFTTGRNPDGYTLTSVDIDFSRSTEDFSSKLTVTIQTDARNALRKVVATLSNPAFVNRQAGTYRFTHSGVKLEPETHYWVVLDGTGLTSSSTRVKTTASDSEDAGAALNWLIDDSAFSGSGLPYFRIASNRALQIGVNGTANPPLVSNFNQVDSHVERLDMDRAQAFTTGSNVGGYILTGLHVDIPSFATGAPHMPVQIRSDDGGSPGKILADWTIDFSTIADVGTQSLTHEGLPLDADTTYWAVVDMDADAVLARVQYTASDAEDPVSADGFSIADGSKHRPVLSSGSWTDSASSLRMAISGEAAEPRRLVSNLGESAAASVSLGSDWAQAFTTGPNHAGYRLTGVDLRFAQIDNSSALDSNLEVQVRRDAGGDPGPWVATLTKPAFSVSNTPAKYVFTHTGLELEADTTYWVRVDGGGTPTAGSRISTTASDAENVGSAPGWSIANVSRSRFDAGTTWSDVSGGRSLHIGVTGVRNRPQPSGEPAVMSNLGEADGAALSVTAVSAVRDRAQSFTTGRNGGHYRLNSVDVVFAEIGDSDAARDLRVQIWAGSGGSPGSNAADVLADLARPSMPVGSADRTFTFTYQGDDGSGLLLEPDTTYWVYVYDASVQPNSRYTLRATASSSERLRGLRLPEGWSIGDGHSSWSLYPNPAVSWSTHSESLKIGLNLGAADAFVQFRTCAGTVSGNDCDTGWVIANYTEHDPPPTITLTEGGPAVTYQWQAVDPQQRRHFYVASQVGEPLSHFGGYIGAGKPDRDRLMCHTGSRSPYNLGDPIVEGLSRDGINFGYGSTAGPLLDRHDGCPFSSQSVYEGDANKWRPVSLAAGQDSDAFDHGTFLIHRPHAVGHNFYENGVLYQVEGFDYPEVRVPLIIRDDDEWEQTLEFSIDDGTTWTSIEDGGLNLAFPASLNTGRKAHYFWVRTKNDPPADQDKRFSISADFAKPLSRSGTSEYFRSRRVFFTSPAASHLHTFRAYDEAAVSAGSVTVGRTPIQVEIHVGANVVGNVTFQVEAYKLYERSDNQISTETPPRTVRTDSFSFYRTLGSCVGCQRLLGDLPDPVVERVGDLGYANLSDTGIDLSWPRVVGAEGYEVRWWSTTSPFPGVPADEAWFGAEPNDPAWGIRHLEPGTEYRAVVYYADHGATQLSTASPVIRFTTLAAGSPVEAEPASVIVERVPEVSISAAAGTVTEGDDAVFTVTVDPAPDAPLDVRVHVAGPSVVAAAHLGERTVNVPTSGSTTFTVPTVDDTNWGSNGMLGATVAFGEGYRQSKFNSYATVYVANNDLPPPPPVQLKRVSDTTATVAWKPQGDGASYLVVWHESFKGIPVLTEVTTTATEHQLTGLNPGSHYVVSVLHGTNQLDKITVRTLAAGAAPETFTVDFDTPAPNTSQPVISVTASGDVTEGADATFTVTANPAPAADLDVSVTVTHSDDSGMTVGQQTVTIPSAGYATLTVATTNDETDEPDGSVTVTVDASAGLDYRVSSSQGTAVVVVADDDGGYTVNPGTIAKVKELASQTQHGTAHVNRWNRVLLAFGAHDGTGVTGGPMTAAEAQDMANRHSSNVWDLVAAELAALETAAAQTPPPPTPEVSVTASSGSTEGDPVTFTITASPAPTADLAVSVTVSQSGDYGATTGQRTVTVPTTGSVTVTVGTTDDSTDETDGSVTATVNTGSGYTVSSTQGAATVAVADDDAPTPAVSVTSASGGTEGDPVTFTITASPAPAADLAVTVTVATTGDYGYGALPTSVTIPASGTATVTVATTDDTTDEPDGSVTLTVDAGSGYTVAAPSAQTADVADDDAPAGYTVDPDVIAKVQVLAAQTQHGTAHVNRWNRVLVAFGEHDGTGVTGGAMTAADAQQMANTHSSPVWDEVAAELTALETAAQTTPPPPPPPEVSITAASAVTEGGDAAFTVTASPAPATALDVTVTVTASGDHGAATGQRTVTIPTTGSVTVTVATTDDSADEPDGSVTATVDAGSGYTVSSTQGAATVAVADNDDPPVVSITAGSAVTEGGDATFTLTASPAPAADLAVSVTVTASGDHGATTGQRTVTIPTTGSVTLTVGTTDDQADESDGSVTVTLNGGSGYTGSGSATVTVADDDPPVVVPVVSIAAGGGVTEGGAATFTVSASPAPSSALDVTVTVTASGDFGASTGQRTVRIAPGQTSVTFTVGTTDDTADEPDGTVTATVDAGSGYTVSSTQGAATAAVADNDDPPVVDQQDQQDQPALTACESRPELLISSPTASRSDATVDFEVSLSCIPSSSPTILLSPVRDGRIGQNLLINLSAEQTTTTVTVTLGNEHQLGLAVVWSSGLANRYTQADVTYTD